MIRLLVAEDFDIIREDLCDIIQQQPDMEVVGSAASGEAIQALAMAVDFDVILMDVEMETTTAGIRATERILEQKPAAKIIFLTAHETDNMILTSMGAGAVDYIVKDVSWKKICDTLRSASVNENFVGTIIREKTREKLVPIYGTPPDLLNPPAGCPFAARCPYAMELCRQYCPNLAQIGPGHESACWLHNRSVKESRGEVKLG